MHNALIFATSLVDSNPSRYQEWIDYYDEFFRDMDTDLVLINDGPTSVSLDLKSVEQIILTPNLGRKSCWNFPGWKRSFYYGLMLARSRGYKHIGHIESDCYITLEGRNEFLNCLNSVGYYTGFCKAYNFPETALQIFNEDWVLNYLLDRYGCQENWHEELDFEKMILEILKPKYMLNGDRYEGVEHRFNSKYTFLSGCTGSSFLRLFCGVM